MGLFTKSKMILVYTSVCFAFGLGALAVIRKPKTLASWVFFFGLGGLSIESLLAFRVSELSAGSEMALEQLGNAILVGGLGNAFWMVFCLTYARGNFRSFLRRWAWLLLVGFLAPLAAFMGKIPIFSVVVAQDQTASIAFSLWGRGLVMLFLAEIVFVIANLEKTFRASVGTTRWRVKYIFMGLGLLFSVRLFVLSQILLYGSFNLSILSLDAVAIIVACILMVVAYGRSGLAELELYPSREILQGSITIVIIGAYLITVGVIAQLVRLLGGGASFQAQAFVVLLGFSGIAILLLSERLRGNLRRFVGRHFHRPTYNFREIWTRFSEETSGVLEIEELAEISAAFLADTFQLHEVGVFVLSERSRELELVYETRNHGPQEGKVESVVLKVSSAAEEEILATTNPFDLDRRSENWADWLKESTPRVFQKGGPRTAFVLSQKGRLLGCVVLSDRVNAAPYTEEERDLLRCLGRHMSTTLHNIEVKKDLMQAKEMEAFQTMSTFFVHDLKNAANSLALTLGNFSKRIDNPEFRVDALRSLEKSLERINGLIGRLSALRGNLELKKAPCDLNALAREVIEDAGHLGGVEMEVRLDEEMPLVFADGEQLKSILRNLIDNAAEALNGHGGVRVATSSSGGQAFVNVEDDGHGMSEEFMRNDLFHPFRSTKNKGLGIGMYQSKMIAEAHLGRLDVESESGAGTTFRLSIPVGNPSNGRNHED